MEAPQGAYGNQPHELRPSKEHLDHARLHCIYRGGGSKLTMVRLNRGRGYSLVGVI